MAKPAGMASCHHIDRATSGPVASRRSTRTATAIGARKLAQKTVQRAWDTVQRPIDRRQTSLGRLCNAQAERGLAIVARNVQCMQVLHTA